MVEGLKTLVTALKTHPHKSRVVESVLWVLWILCRRVDNQQRVIITLFYSFFSTAAPCSLLRRF